jgi:hypothetical protein
VKFRSLTVISVWGRTTDRIFSRNEQQMDEMIKRASGMGLASLAVLAGFSVRIEITPPDLVLRPGEVESDALDGSMAHGSDY